MGEEKNLAPFSKAEIVNFVKDMAEMEEREFALRKAAEEMGNHAAQNKQQASDRLIKAKKKFELRTDFVKWQKQAVDNLAKPDELKEPIMPVKPIEPERPTEYCYFERLEEYEQKVKNGYRCSNEKR